jgi:hypothetical protein
MSEIKRGINGRYIVITGKSMGESSDYEEIGRVFAFSKTDTHSYYILSGSSWKVYGQRARIILDNEIIVEYKDKMWLAEICPRDLADKHIPPAKHFYPGKLYKVYDRGHLKSGIAQEFTIINESELKIIQLGIEMTTISMESVQDIESAKYKNSIIVQAGNPFILEAWIKTLESLGYKNECIRKITIEDRYVISGQTGYYYAPEPLEPTKERIEYFKSLFGSIYTLPKQWDEALSLVSKKNKEFKIGDYIETTKGTHLLTSSGSKDKFILVDFTGAGMTITDSKDINNLSSIPYDKAVLSTDEQIKQFLINSLSHKGIKLGSWIKHQLLDKSVQIQEFVYSPEKRLLYFKYRVLEYSILERYNGLTPISDPLSFILEEPLEFQGFPVIYNHDAEEVNIGCQTFTLGFLKNLQEHQLKNKIISGYDIRVETFSIKITESIGATTVSVKLTDLFEIIRKLEGGKNYNL